MSLIILAVVLAFVLFLYWKYSEKPQNKKVAFSDNKNVFFYYQDGCPYCEEMKPAWEEAQKLLSEKGWNINSLHLPDLKSTKHEIKGVPTLIFEKDGKVFYYEGPRTVDHICEFSDAI